MVPQEDVDLNAAWEKACSSFFKATEKQIKGQGPQPDALVQSIRDQKKKDEKKNAKFNKIANIVNKTVICIEQIGGALGQIASMFFGPSQMCMNAFSFFVEAARAYEKIFLDLEDLLSTALEALDRFAIYLENQQKIDKGMKRIANEILLQFVSVCELNYKVLNKNKFGLGLKIALFKSDAGVQEAMAAFQKMIDRETQIRATYNYVSAKTTEQNVVNGFNQTNHSLGDVKTELKGLKNQNDRDRQLATIRENLGLGKGDGGQRELYRMYTRSAAPGTGQWLFEHSSFISWMENQSRDKARVLLLSGDEGCGKTYVLSAAAQHLMKTFPQGKEDMSRTSVASYYLKNHDKSRKDANELPGASVEEYTMQSALRVLSFQVSENDPIYRKGLLDMSSSIETVSELRELWRLLFKRQKDNGTAYLLVDGTHVLDDRQDLKELILEIIDQPMEGFRVQVLVSGRPEVLKTLSSELGTNVCLIDVAANNEQDIQSYIKREVEAMPLLKRAPDLRQEICESLKGIGNSFGHMSLILQQIRTKQRPSEIRFILDEARKGGDILDTISRQVEACNLNLDDMDIKDLNQLLEWCMGGWFDHALETLEEVLTIRKMDASDSSLKPLYERLKNEFSGFFSISPDMNDPGSRVSLASDKVKEYFRIRTESENDGDESAAFKISALEVNIVQRFLKNLCDESLYNKFEFDQFFKQKTGATSKVFVNTYETDAKIVLDLLRVITGKVDQKKAQMVFNYAISSIGYLLSNVDLSLVSPKLKSELGRNLIDMFYDTDTIQKWIANSLACSMWFYNDENCEQVMKCLKDSAVIRSASSEEREWIDAIKQNTDNERHLMEKVAKVAAEFWLHGVPNMTFEVDEDYYMKYTRLIGELYCFIRAFLHIIDFQKGKVNEAIDKLAFWVIEDDETIQYVLKWAQVQIGLKCMDRTFYCQVGMIYSEAENFSKAEQLFQEALRLPGEDISVQRQLADLYETQRKWRPAAEMLEEMVKWFRQQLSMRKSDSKQNKDNLDKSLLRLAKLKRKLYEYDEAMEIYQQLLGGDHDNYKHMVEVIDLLMEQKKSEEVVAYFDRLKTEIDHKSGNDRLTQMLIALATIEGRHEMIEKTSRATNYISTIKVSYEKAMKVAEKTPRSEETKKEIPFSVVTVHLKCCMARLLYRAGSNENDRQRALILLEEALDIEVPPSSLYLHGTARPKRMATFVLLQHYLSKASAIDHNSEAAKRFLEKAETFRYEEDSVAGRYVRSDDFRLAMAYYYVSVGQAGKAREELKDNIEVNMRMLVDDDEWNDTDAWRGIADSLIRLRDDEKAQAAWSQIAPNRNVPVTSGTGDSRLQDADSESDKQASISSENIVKKTLAEHSTRSTLPKGDVQTSVAEGESTMRTVGLDRAYTSESLKKPKGPMYLACSCMDDDCESIFTYADDIWVCRQCPEVYFTGEHLERMRRGELYELVCDPLHEFFHVPPWDFENAARVGKGNVEVAGEIITAKDWLERLRKEWNISESILYP